MAVRFVLFHCVLDWYASFCVEFMLLRLIVITHDPHAPPNETPDRTWVLCGRAFHLQCVAVLYRRGLVFGFFFTLFGTR